MSYDLAVWAGDRPLDNHQAGSTYDELYERYLESDEVVVPPVPDIRAYVEALSESSSEAAANVVPLQPKGDEQTGTSERRSGPPLYR
ncbi:hypothetical protein AB0K64_29270 [Streptomyces sp. NPDC053741]|uniref:hypothetical protein n=1 Tax=Streptomyces TaxID=1883 RepID=UPI00056580F9|nr:MULTISPECIES: hypothetical protein [Streptomyces]MBD2834924.1 hypothetical protein [Streptomyces pratensis]WSZ52261.1 hypothetical protein OG337_35020 [[Kitasatospora] papulosa]MCY1655496.1 hypothetical protein [Streptomyces sp. SL203]MCY1677154.1 hypothetical protein [Streptomyces sp. SL294]MDF6066752.1 hypothetical protein [Streptomyces sp. JH010]